MPLRKLESIMKKDKDWHWPAKHALTDEDLAWFPLRMDKWTKEPDDLDKPLPQPVPAELRPVVR